MKKYREKHVSKSGVITYVRLDYSIETDIPSLIRSEGGQKALEGIKKIRLAQEKNKKCGCESGFCMVADMLESAKEKFGCKLG